MEATDLSLQGGRYVLEEHLGSGHFGEVWRGQDKLQGDVVAIKLTAFDVTLDELLLEAQVLTRLARHDRVVTIRNVDVNPPRPFIVMEYLENGSVEKRVEDREVSVVDAIRWTRDALDGLAFVHSVGIIHRDIKPGNLLLDHRGSAVLSDFGLAEDTIRNLIASEKVYLPHAAPELTSGGPSSVVTDIYAMGCTLYRLLTGDYPFADLAEAQAGRITDPHRLNLQIPLRLTRVVRRALAPKPEDRYPDARAMLSELLACGVVNCWHRIDDAESFEEWVAKTQSAIYRLRVTERSSNRWEVRVLRDLGSGPRRVFRIELPRRVDAIRVMRTALLTLVEGRSYT